MAKTKTASMAVDRWRATERRARLEALRVNLRGRRDQREAELRALGVPEGAWHDVALDAEAVINPAIEPFEGLQIVFFGPRRAYEQWRLSDSVNGYPEGDRADWLAAEVWVITQLLMAIDSGDVQHVANLSRLMTMCEVNWRWPERVRELNSEKIRASLKRAADETAAFDWAAERSAELVAGDDEHNQTSAARVIMNTVKWRGWAQDGVTLPPTPQALVIAIKRYNKSRQT